MILEGLHPHKHSANWMQVPHLGKVRIVTHFDDAVYAATDAAEELAIDLLEKAVRRRRSEELEDCDDWHGVLDLVDEEAWQIYGEGIHQRVCRLLTEAGVDLPIDPETHGFCESHIVIEAVSAACGELAAIRLGEMPTSIAEALPLATARIHYERARLGPSSESAAAIDDWRRRLFYCRFELDLLVGLGMIVVREGRPVLPSTEDERSAACHALQVYLVSDVLRRLGSYDDPHEGQVEVRHVTLTADEEAAVRAAARQIHATAM